MARSIKLFLMISIFLGVSFQIASSEDSLKIDAGALEINNISAKKTRSLMIYNSMGNTAELVGPEGLSILKKYAGARDDHIPAKGFTTVGNKIHGHYQEKIELIRSPYILIKLKFEINNISDSTQTFRVGDITLGIKDSQIDFMAVGPNDLAYRVKGAGDWEDTKDVVYNLEPNETRRFTYVFTVWHDRRPLMLSYKKVRLVKLKTN